jgi:hypothetical protein
VARSKPNKPLKSPNKQQKEEQNKTKNTQIVTPHIMNTNTKTTGTDAMSERTEKRNISQEKYKPNP